MRVRRFAWIIFFCSTHLLQGLELKQQPFFSISPHPPIAFRLLHRQHVCFWMHSDVHFCFSSLSFSLLSASPSFVVTRHRLSFAHSASPAVALPFSHLVRLPVAVVDFLIVLLFRRQHLIHSLQLVVAIAGLPLVYFSFS